MCALAATQIPKPRDEQDFEDACVELWRDLLGDPNVQANGRRGQRQDGVDLFGNRDRDPHQQVGVQCKLKGPNSRLTEKEVRDEVALAREFRPHLSEYVIATTALDDQALQRVARELTLEFHGTGHPMTVAVWGWGTMERRIAGSPHGRKAFEPGRFPQGEQILALVEDRSDHILAGQTQIEDLILSLHAKMVGMRPVDADATITRSAVEAALDAQIDDLRDMGNAGKPRAALDQFTRLLDRVRASASGRILFRLTANIGVCRLGLGEDEEAARLLIEAYHHAPDEPKAVANRMLADLIRGNWQSALVFGREALAADPGNEALASYVIQAASRDPSIEDPIDLVPEALRTAASVMVAHAHALWRPGSSGRWRQAARDTVAAHPEDEHARQLAALADLDEVMSGDRFQKERILLAAERRQVEQAVAVLRPQWDAARRRDVPPRAEHLTLCGNLAVATFMVGQGDDALTILRQGLALAPDDEGLIVRAASIAIDGVDGAFARDLLPRLPATPEGVTLRFRLHLQAGAWPELKDLLSDHLEDLPLDEQGLGRTVVSIANLAVLGVRVNEADLGAVTEAAAGDARASSLVATFARDHGLVDAADKTFAAAVEAASHDDHIAGRLTVAHLAEQRGEWSVVADLLLGHVDEARDHAELRMLARALVNDLPIRERALRFFERLPEAVRETPSNLYSLGLTHLNRGALPEAEDALRRAIAAEPGRAAPHLALVSALHRMGRRDDLKGILDGLDLAVIEGTPPERMGIAQALRAAGLGAKALAYGYDVLQSARNDPTVAMRYVGLVLVPDDGSIPVADAVAPDTWFSIIDEAGTPLSYLIEGQKDRQADRVLSPSHPTAAAAIGRRPGETFSLPNSNRTWRVVEVKHRILHAAHEVMESFEEDFPNASGFHRVSITDGDLQPALNQVRRTSEALRARADLYLNDHFPLSMVASQMGRDAIGLADYVRSLGRDVRACAGDLPERVAALQLIKEQRATGAVLDAYTAWTAANMDALDVLIEVFGSLQIPQSALDELSMMQDRLGPPGGEGPVMTMAWRDGQFYRQEFSADDVGARQAMVEEQVAKIRARCEVVPSVAPDDPSDLARTLTDVFDDAVLDTANLAARGRVLVSEDQNYRATAEMATGACGVWLQAVFLFAVKAHVIEPDRYDDLLVGLAMRRHGHVPLESRSLLRAMQQDGDGETWRFDALAGFIGTSDADVASHVRVVRTFLHEA